MQNKKIHVIGIPPDGASSIPQHVYKLIEQAEMAFGGKHLLDLFPALSGEKIVISNNLSQITALLKKNVGNKHIVILASGDPNLYGIAGYLEGKLDKESIEIIPAVSAMQLAFACIKESWSDAVFTSVHSRPIEDIINIVRLNRKIAIFTDDNHSPAAVAKVLIKQGIEGYRGYVCVRLGTSDQKVTEAGLRDLCRMKYQSPNILILIKTRQQKNAIVQRQHTGIPDEEFYRRKPKSGLITKQEVRAISLSKMNLKEESIVWDIGAGSGAVAIEASFVARKGRIYAVEKNETDVSVIKKNIKKFCVSNVEIVHTYAPKGLDRLPSPSSVFIGGSGGKMEEIIEAVSGKLVPGGRIIVNVVALENLNTSINILTEKGFSTDIILVNIARSIGIKDLTRFEPLNPVFIITAISPEEK